MPFAACINKTDTFKKHQMETYAVVTLHVGVTIANSVDEVQ